MYLSLVADHRSSDRNDRDASPAQSVPLEGIAIKGLRIRQRTIGVGDVPCSPEYSIPSTSKIDHPLRSFGMPPGV